MKPATAVETKLAAAAVRSDRPNIWRIAALTFAVCAVTLMSVQPQAENDFWLQARLGAWIASEYQIPQTLLFPFTLARDYPFNAHEWLPSLLFHGVVTLVGEPGLPFVLGGLGLALFAFTCLVTYRNTNGSLTLALGAGLVVMVSENFRHFLRPELLTVFLLLASLFLLERLRRRSTVGDWISLHGLQVLWANSHGSFVLLPMLGAIVAADVVWSRWFQPSTLSTYRHSSVVLILPVSLFLSSLLTPFDIELWQFSLGFGAGIDSFSKQEIIEWMPLWDTRSHAIQGLWPAVGVGLLPLLLLWVERHQFALRHIGIAMLFLFLATQANRFLVYLGPILAWLVPLSPRLRSIAKHRVALASMCICWLLLGLSVLFRGNLNGSYPWDARSNHAFPPSLARFLEQGNLRGPVFNSYDLGGELTFRGYPRLQPSIDSRIDSYGDAYFEWHESLLDRAQAFTDFLREWKVQYLLLTKDDYLRYMRIEPAVQRKCQLILTDKRIFLFSCGLPHDHPTDQS